MFHRIWAYRDLLRQYVATQYRLRYRQSFFGVAWAVIPPLVTLGVATIVFHRVARISTGTVPYSLFTLSALIPWSFFAGGMNSGIGSISGAQPIVTRLPFPRAILPLSSLGISLVDLAVASAIYMVFALAYGVGLHPAAAWLPLLLVIEIAFVSGLVFLGSALNMFARDLRTLAPLAIQMWLFVTPVMYPLASVPKRLQSLYLLNPMTGLVESFREALIYGQSPQLRLLAPAIVGAFFFLLVGTWYFGATEQRFADVI